MQNVFGIIVYFQESSMFIIMWQFAFKLYRKEIIKIEYNIILRYLMNTYLNIFKVHNCNGLSLSTIHDTPSVVVVPKYGTSSFNGMAQ